MAGLLAHHLSPRPDRAAYSRAGRPAAARRFSRLGVVGKACARLVTLLKHRAGRTDEWDKQFLGSARVAMDLATKQYLIALGVLALGLSGFLLPFKWNLLKLRRPYDKLLSEGGNMIVPKVFGSVLILMGLTMVVLTVTGEDFITRP